MGSSGGSSGAPNAAVVRKFAFNHATAGLLTGAALYTPKVGDLLLDMFVRVTTAWDGTAPFGDYGTFSGGIAGLLNQIGLSGANGLIDMSNVDVAITSNAGLLAPNQVTSLALANLMYLETGLLTAVGASTPFSIEGGASFALDFGPSSLGMMFTAADPIKVCVSQDGGAGTTPSSFDSTTPPPVLPLVVAAGVNDQYNFTLNRGVPAADLFTVAAASYATTALLAAALNAATDAGAHSFVSKYGTWADDGSGNLSLTLLAAGANGSTVTAGTNDIVANLGLSTTTTTGGAGGDPGSTQGAGILYLVTATPA